MFSTTLVFVLVGLFVEWLRRRWNTFQYFKRMGIPGPEPSLLWGHYKQIREDHVLWLGKWKAEYGKTFGVFWGDKPFLVTSDLDIAKQVLISQFSNFVNRGNQFALESAHPIAKHMVTLLKEQEWKRIRMLLSPGFSTGKMKNMTPLIVKGIDDFETNLRKNTSEKQFDVYPLLKRLTVDNIGRTVFGIETNIQQNPEATSLLLKSALNFVDNAMTGIMDLICNCFSIVNAMFSSLLYVLLYVGLIPHCINDLIGEIDAIVKARRNSPPRNDIMQSLLDRQQINTDDASLTASDSAEDQKSSSSKTASGQLSNEEVTASAVVMFIAGYETTSTALAFILGCLGQHTEVQERLRREIVDATNGKDVSYETAMNLPYLDAVIREALRLNPPVTGFNSRAAVRDTEINGLKIPAGLNILFPTKQIHLDEEFWENPTTFNPDRFLEKKHNPLAYMVFGDGPRNCVGMRFALLTIKMILCRVIPKFEFAVTEDFVTKSVVILSQPVQLNISVKEIGV